MITLDPDNLNRKFVHAKDAVACANLMQELTSEQKACLKDNPALADILLDPKLSRHQRKLQALPFMRKKAVELAGLEKEHDALTAKIQSLESVKLHVAHMQDWIERPEFKLEKNDCSRLHKLLAAFSAGKVFHANKKEWCTYSSKLLDNCNVFVVQHDWAAAFKSAGDYDDGDFRLPYQVCVFELRISGVTVIVLACQEDDGNIVATPFTQWGDIWMDSGELGRDQEPLKFAWLQIRAISIALDAEVASHTVVRAPHKLNVKREREGKLPLYDYRIVSMTHRSRAIGPTGIGGSGTKKRLHFRRGHWRHYAESKSWVRWTLVGNPELGFIDKEYRL